MHNKYIFLVSNTLIFAIGNLLSKLISFFLMPLYTSVLSADQYGTSELLNSSVEIVLPIITLCIVDAVYRFSIDGEGNEKQLFSNACLLIFIGNLLAAIIAFIVYLFNSYDYVFCFVLLLFSSSVYKLVIQFARGIGDSKRYAFYGVLNTCVLVISNIFLLSIFNFGIEGYLWSYILANIISALAGIVMSKEYLFFDSKSINILLLKQMLRYSLPGIPNMISWWINTVSARYIIMYFCGVSYAGLYAAASKLPAMINFFTSIFQQAWQYSTVKELNSDDNSDFFSNVFRFYSYLVGVSCGLLIVICQFVCKFLLKEAFFDAWELVPALLIAAYYGCIATYFGTFYNALKNNTILMYSTLFGAVVNLCANFLLVPFYGYSGAAISAVLAYISIMVFRIIDVRSKINIRISYPLFIIQNLLLVVCAFNVCNLHISVISYIVIALLLLTDISSINIVIECFRRFLAGKLVK